jgi:hypothetical protein
MLQLFGTRFLDLCYPRQLSKYLENTDLEHKLEDAKKKGKTKK